MIDTPFSSWSAARWYELAYVSQWLWDKLDAPGFDTQNIYPQVLWDIMSLARDQGYNWPDFWLSDRFPRGAVTNTTLYTHGVNNAQALKSIPISSRFSEGNRGNKETPAAAAATKIYSLLMAVSRFSAV